MVEEKLKYFLITFAFLFALDINYYEQDKTLPFVPFLLKISQTSGGWGFTFRLPDSQVRNRKNRYRIVSNKNGTK